MYHYHEHDHCRSRRFYHHGHGSFHRMPPWMQKEMFGGHRAERGDVRYLILDALREEEGHGYQVIQKIKERSGGRYQPSPGAIYPTLQMLTEEGLLEARPEGNKTIYSITEAGLEELEANADEVEDAYDRLGFDGSWHDIDFSRFPKLMKRFARTGKMAMRRNLLNQKTFDEVMDVLEEAVSRVEIMLKK